MRTRLFNFILDSNTNYQRFYNYQQILPLFILKMIKLKNYINKIITFGYLHFFD